MVKLAGFLALVGCRPATPKTVQSQVTSGPLTILCTVKRTPSGASYNLGGKPRGVNVTSYFSVQHQGKTVPVTTTNGAAAYFWQALFLKDAPVPAVLVATHSVYLITKENGRLKHKLMDQNEGDFAKYQWLDSEDGQPGKQQRVYLGDDSKSSRFLSGGRYLLINTRTLLDVQSLVTYPIDNNSAALVDQLDGYNAFQSEVIGFSPEKTQLVLIGYRRNTVTNRSEYALVAIDFVKNEAYAIPFDRTATRFFSIRDATPIWLETYFDWTVNLAGKEVLSLHKFKKLPYWRGKSNVDEEVSPHNKRYQLTPVLPGMIAQFMNYVEEHYPVADIETKVVSTQTINEFTIKGSKLALYFNSTDKTLSLYADDKQLLKEIGKLFDKELAKGRFQTDFGTFDFD